MLDTFRRRIHRAFRKYRGVHILLNTPSPDELRRLDYSLENIERMPGPELRHEATAFKAEYKKIVKMYGVCGNVEEFEEILDEYAAASKPILYVAKFDLERLFTKYENRFPNLRKLPPHGRVGIEVGGRRSLGTEVETFLLEASLFEDMAALWNSASAATIAALPKDSTVPEEKNAAALRRATTKAAFSLMEGYLNGLALDVQLICNPSAKEKVLLEEWDEAKNRPARLTLRDKILQYVRMAALSQHPPIQESNSDAMGIVLATESAVRHALIHPTPRHVQQDHTYRENVYLNLTLEQVQAVCDAVVKLIREIGSEIGPRFGDVESWLFNRDETGRYPDRHLSECRNPRRSRREVCFQNRAIRGRRPQQRSQESTARSKGSSMRGEGLLAAHRRVRRCVAKDFRCVAKDFRCVANDRLTRGEGPSMRSERSSMRSEESLMHSERSSLRTKGSSMQSEESSVRLGRRPPAGRTRFFTPRPPVDDSPKCALREPTAGGVQLDSRIGRAPGTCPALPLVSWPLPFRDVNR